MAKSAYPEWVNKYKERGTSIKKVGDNYYLYKTTSKRVKGKDYPVTKSTYIGIITKGGLIETHNKIRKDENCKCALCGKVCDLTFEHIPPRNAFNNQPTKQVSMVDLTMDFSRKPWEIDGLPYVNNQKGGGMYSLCRECNNNTGSWYGNDYIEFARTVSCALKKENLQEGHPIVFLVFYPLRIIKQIISMFCSVNRSCGGEDFQTLRDFVLNKEQVHLDSKKFKVCMYFTKDSMNKFVPYSVMCIKTKKNPFATIALSEIVTYPIGLTLYFNPEEEMEYDGIDITSFSKCNYNDKCDIQIPVCIKESNSYFPGDYRSKEEITKAFENAINKKNDNN